MLLRAGIIRARIGLIGGFNHQYRKETRYAQSNVGAMSTVCNSGLDVTRLHCPHCNTGIVGDFAVCDSASCRLNRRLLPKSSIKCQGNIKEVEKELGISYPTVRNRLRP